jgi:general secretion pathway protein C
MSASVIHSARVCTLPTLVATLLGVALMARAALIVRSALKSPTAALPPAAFKLHRAPRPGATSGSVASIVQAHLFGLAAPDPATGADAPLSTQALLLTGTFATPEPGQGLAILGEKVESARLYSVGARIGGGAVLRQVFADHVILDRGGQLEKVKLLDWATIGSGAIGQPRHVVANATAAAEDAAAPVGEGAGRAVVHMKTFALLPVFSDRSRGARIGMPSNPLEFNKTGLRAGDIITAVNGVAVHSAQGAASLLQDAGGGSLTLTVQRGAGTESVVVDSLE